MSSILQEDLDFIESELTFDDKISLLFLLYGHRDPQYLLQVLTITCRSPKEETHFLSEWAHHLKNKERWDSELLEALVIIQANLVLLKCGFEVEQLAERFLPHVPELATFVHPILKGLFLLCEKMDPSTSTNLTNFLRRTHAVEASGVEHFEIVLLKLIVQKLILTGSKMNEEECDLLVLNAACKALEFDELNEFCKSLANSFNNDLVTKVNQSDNAKSSESFKNHSEPKEKSKQIQDDSQVDKYTITRENAGILLIVNQYEFYREPNAELCDLLPLKHLKNRRGTDVDKLAIINLFTALGYQPIVVENIPHLELLSQVENAVNQIKSNHCSLVVCLLSHGQEGRVYGANSIPVSVKTIEKKMASEKLTGKPKLLFVQACQGSDLQAAVEIPQKLEHDGPSSETTASVFVDFLVAWSTVPGFASVRHIEKGSWFIQELCQKVRLLHQRDHLMDILTAVINDVSSKRGYGNECMVPIIYSTLRKKLYFEPLCD